MKGLFLSLLLICLVFCGVEASYLIQQRFANVNVNWASLNAKELSQVSAVAFQNITSAQLSSIPEEACSGFVRDQLDQLNARACVGFSAGCMNNISPAAVNGLTIHCISELSIGVVSSFSINQVSNISTLAMRGFTKNQISSLNPQACRGLSGPQIESLSYGEHVDVCEGLSAACLGNLTSNTITKFTSSCFSQILPENVKGFSPQVFKYFTSETLSYIGGMQLVQFVKVFGSQFVDVINQKQLELIGPPSIIRYKQFVGNGKIERTRQISLDEIPDLTWLQLTLSTDESILKVLTLENIRNLHKSAMMGFLSNFETFPSDFFTSLSINQLNYLLEDSISSLTLEQVETLPPQLFGDSNTFSSNVKYINTKAVQGITPPQLQALFGRPPGSKDETYLLTCQQFKSLTNDQIKILQVYKFFNQMKLNCAQPNQSSNTNPSKSLKNNAPTKNRKGNYSIYLLLTILLVIVNNF